MCLKGFFIWPDDMAMSLPQWKLCWYSLWKTKFWYNILFKEFVTMILPYHRVKWKSLLNLAFYCDHMQAWTDIPPPCSSVHVEPNLPILALIFLSQFSTICRNTISMLQPLLLCTHSGVDRYLRYSTSTLPSCCNQSPKYCHQFYCICISRELGNVKSYCWSQNI